MKTIISEQKKTFQFSRYYPSGTCTCNMTIHIQHYQLCNSEKYYDLTYSYEYPHLTSEREGVRYPAHPFYQTKCEPTGVIVHSNKMTQAIIDFLLMDDDTLTRESDGQVACQYRASILISLDRLRD